MPEQERTDPQPSQLPRKSVYLAFDPQPTYKALLKVVSSNTSLARGDKGPKLAGRFQQRFMPTLAERLLAAFAQWKRQDPKTNTKAELARQMGVSPQAITGWFTTGRISKDLLPRFSEVTGVSLDEVLTGRNNTANPGRMNYRKVPLISWVQAGLRNPVADPYPPGAPEAWEDATVPVSGSSFALVVRGDSMIAPDGSGFPEGSIIFVEPTIEAKSGDYVVVRFNDTDEATFKRYVIDGPNTLLRALNPAYPTIPLTADAQLCGVVVEVNMRRRFR